MENDTTEPTYTINETVGGIAEYLFNDDWYFVKMPPDSQTPGADASIPSINALTSDPVVPIPGPDAPWIPVTLPHDWLIYDTRNLYEDGDGWYRKYFSFPLSTAAAGTDTTNTDATVNADTTDADTTDADTTDADTTDADTINADNVRGKHIFINFDGVYMDCEVFLNGHHVFEWKYGYTAFTVDLTTAVQPGGNELALRVKHRSPNSRWYSGAGIYRDVRMNIKNADYLREDGIYITPVRENDRRWRIEVEIMDTDAVVTNAQSYALSHTISDESGRIAARCVNEYARHCDYHRDNHRNNSVHQTMYIENPLIWDIDAPHLYTLTTELFVNGVCVDRAINRFGCRTIHFTPDKGFYLNDRRVILRGVCQHHDLGALGAAVNRDAIKRQFVLLREMGVNAIRTAHNPPARVWMTLAAEMGFLVLSEILDMWRMPKTPYDYARFFDEWIERDVASWICRDRNNPAVIMWSVGNEIYDTHAGEEGRATLTRLTALVRWHDPKCHAPTTLCSNYMPWTNTQICAEDIRLIGYNYAEYLYARHHEDHPSWIIYGGETGSTVQSRGVYHFPLAQSVLADDDMQCSALGNSATSWGAKNVEACILADRDAEFSLGQFVWTGFDYIGEPTPYTTKNAYFGHVDTAGFKKDSFYLFQSAWTDYKTAPMLHILPYWDFSPGQWVDVRVYTNAPKATLFLNGKNLGTVIIDHRQGHKITGDWRVLYEPGALTALAYDENGTIIAQAKRHSFGDAYRLNLHAADAEGVTYAFSPSSSPGNSPDRLVFVEITATDHQGYPVENANNRVRLSVTNARIVGMDNGDSTDYDPYKTDNRRMFNGKLLAILSPTRPDWTLLAESPGLIAATLPSSAASPMAAVPQSNPTPIRPDDDIPVRAIELTATHGGRLHPQQPETRVTALLKPITPEPTYRDLVWRLTDAAGIDSPLAVLTVAADGLSAVVKAKGDGTLYVRCGVKNGGETLAFYSLLMLTITGMGKTCLNPYTFVSGGLYTVSNVPMTNGNDRGVATLREGESQVGYADLDFGPYGSDTLTVPLFPLNKEPFPVEIWEGMPGEGGELLCTVTYDKGSIWNTYQDLMIKLPRRLTGITTLCFVLRQKVHIKGFIFTPYNRAFEKLFAAENDGIYGDRFVIDGRHVTHIGNNVSIIFREMDFGTADAVGVAGVIGATQIEIASAARKQKNSVLLSFVDAAGTETKVMLEIPGTPVYQNAVFSLGRRITGVQTLTWIFLPGCDMDLAWFRFSS